MSLPRSGPASCCVCGKPGSEADLWTNHAIDRLHGVPGQYSYVRCPDCWTVFQHPQVVPEDISQLYPEEYSPWRVGAGRVAPASPWKRRLRDALTITGLPKDLRQRLNSGARLLDVGCGNGRFLARIQAEHPSARPEGLDFSPDACRAAAEALGLPIHCGTLAALAADGQLQPQSFDIICAWWYLEHEPDPLGLLRAANDLLIPGGMVVMGVPSAASLAMTVFGSRWFHLDPPRHLWIFHPATVGRLFQNAGLEVERIGHDYSPWGLLGSLQYLLRGQINGVERSWVASRWGQLALRPLAGLLGLAGRGDTIAIYARKPFAA